MQDSVSTTPLLPGSQQEVEEGDNHHGPRARSTTTTTGATKWMNLILAPLTDDRGDPASVVTGLTTLCISGALLGIFVAPHDDDLHPPTYRVISAAVGYIYFLAWSVSFYPQVLANCRRGTTVGLSVDFCLLNVLGFACYTAYTVSLYSSPSIRNEYRDRQHPTNTTNTTDAEADVEIPVESNDVAFCIHALVLSCITLAQIIWYKNRNENGNSLSTLFLLNVRPMTARLLVVLMIWIVVVGPALVLVPNHITSWHWLDYLYSLSAIKVLISLVKYMPQVVLNMERQSTAGWSIWQILLDLTGGLLSDVQLVGDTLSKTPTTGGRRSASAAWRAIWMGNPAKLALGTLSMLFDVIFMVQHYILYPPPPSPSSSPWNNDNISSSDQVDEGEIINNNINDHDDADGDDPTATTHDEDEREHLTTATAADDGNE